MECIPWDGGSQPMDNTAHGPHHPNNMYKKV